MTRRRTVQIFVTALIGLIAFGTSSVLATEVELVGQAEPNDETVALGAQIFSQSCSNCHQAGGIGVPGVFPPLLNNPNAADADYVTSVVTDGLSGPITVLGVGYDATMAAAALSAEQTSAVVAYVGTLATGGSTAITTPPADAVGPPDADHGRSLFTGSSRFENGGVACSSCHQAGSVGSLGGPTLGPDLTTAIANFGGIDALSGWLANPPSPTMIPVFADHPLTAQEVADVAAFLADAPQQSEPSYPGDVLLWSGLIGLVVLLSGMAVVWRGMRQTYADKLKGARR